MIWHEELNMKKLGSTKRAAWEDTSSEGEGGGDEQRDAEESGSSEDKSIHIVLDKFNHKSLSSKDIAS